MVPSTSDKAHMPALHLVTQPAAHVGAGDVDGPGEDGQSSRAAGIQPELGGQVHRQPRQDDERPCVEKTSGRSADRDTDFRASTQLPHLVLVTDLGITPDQMDEMQVVQQEGNMLCP